MIKVNPAGVNAESVWLNKHQEQSVRVLSIFAETLTDVIYQDNAVQNPQSYDEAVTVFQEFMPETKFPKCPTMLKRSPFWQSMRLLAQCLPLYKALYEYNQEEKNSLLNRILAWFEDTVEQEFKEIIGQSQKALPENLPNQ